jgi:hypothetical protein
LLVLFFWLLLGNFFRKRFSETAGNFRQNGTQLELIEYHDEGGETAVTSDAS